MPANGWAVGQHTHETLCGQIERQNLWHMLPRVTFYHS